jgi:hypothetical protein
MCDARQPPSFRALNDIFRYTTKELLNITAQYATSKKAAKALLVPSGREAAPNSSKAAPSNITAQDAMKDAKGGKKRRKQRPQWVATVVDYDSNDNEKANDSNKEHVTTAVYSGQCQARPPTELFERLLEEACMNHAYRVKHKLKDCAMMKNLMTSGSFT